MKRISTKAVRLLNLGWLVVFLSAHGQMAIPAVQGAANPPPEITLNGLTTILGDKRALFKVWSDSGAKISYCLAEGQGADGIKLLSVDIQAGKIQVNNHGVIQIIPLCNPPNLSTLVVTNKNEVVGFNDRQNSKIISAGEPEITGKVAGQNATAGNLTSGSPGAATSASFGAQTTEPFTVRAASEFERLRIQSAAAVYDGTEEPLPLTPLTPPGTPMALIGPGRAWFPD